MRNKLILATIVLLAAVTADFGQTPKTDSVGKTESENHIQVAEARRLTRVLHDTYVATLHTVHRQYFDEGERETIPARALEDVFRQIDRETGGTTRWISVNTPAMNIDHRPKDGFEKDAARRLASGDREFERVENGAFHRAGAVSLFAGCTKCHLSGLRPQTKVRSVAGLVISLPVKTD